MPKNRSSTHAPACGLCSDSENDQMVACDLCDKWYHFKCVHVGDSVADQSWSCPACRNELLAASTPVGHAAKSVISHRSGISSSSSIRAARAALELQQLEERKQLELKRVLEEEERRKQEAELEKARIEQQKLQCEMEAELERKKLERQRRQHEEEQALAKKKIEDEKLRTDLLRSLEEKYLAEKYRILNSQLEVTSTNPSSNSSVSSVHTANMKQQRPSGEVVKDAEDVRNKQTDNRVQNGVDTNRERLNKMRYEEDKRREESRRMLEQMGFAEKFNMLYGPRMQNAAEWAMNLPLEESVPGGMPPFPEPMSKSGQGKYTGAYPKANQQAAIDRDPVSAFPSVKRVECPTTQVNWSGSGVDRSRQQIPPSSFPSQPLHLPTVPEESCSYPGQRALRSELNPGQVQAASHINPGLSGLTNSQLAARQVLPKDLPSFSGNPEDWPVFISNFENSTTECGYSNAENLIRLQRCLRGDALAAVRSRLLLPASVPSVIDTLSMLFGRPEVLINSLLEQMRCTPSPREGRLDTLIAYGMAVQNYCDHLVAAKQEVHLSNPTMLHELVEKLPSEIKLKWVDFKDTAPVVNLATFGRFMTQMVRKASEVTTYRPTSAVKASKDEIRKGSSSKAKGYVNHHSDHRSSSDDKMKAWPKVCPACSKSGHALDGCGAFKSFSAEDRWKVIRMHNLCRTCLKNHNPFPCRRPKDCPVSGCRLRHHPLLHASESKPSPQNYHSGRHGVIYRIIPVTAYGALGSINTFALLDEASEVTMIEKNLADNLGLKGALDPLHLRWTGNVTRVEEHSCVVKLEISGTSIKRRFSLVNARTVESMELPVQSIKMDDLIESFPYLKGLPIEGYEEARPQLLIGLENLYLAAPLKIREGNRGQPVATKTRLGWCVYGGVLAKSEPTRAFFHVSRPSEDQQLHQLVKQHILMDSLETSPLGTKLESTENTRARQILESTTRRVPGGFETGLLWKEDEVRFPNSYPMALSRLKSMERKMQKSPGLVQRVHALVDDYLKKGYARAATEDDLGTNDQDRKWYLPLGLVINPKKPQKLRLIWDAAAQVNGVSLNSKLLSGPDMLMPLTSVQYRFRQRRVAITGDIKEMYHQFKILQQDQKSQMFLYRKDPSEEPTVYLMTVGIFGAACSPCSAQYIKNLNAKEYEQDFPDAAEAIVKGHYVDDFLDSRDSVEEVLRLAEDVRYVHQQGGFEIRNFSSNRPEVISRLGEQCTSAVKVWSSESDVAESVLGIRWLPKTDELTFSAYFPSAVENLLDGFVRPTKRQVLKTVMSLYDPLGFLATFVIQGKIIIQDLWRSSCGWDDQVDDAVFNDWQRWVNLLPRLNDIRVPRAYFGDGIPECCQPIQLHTFVDGSSTAYACVVYIRFVQAGQPRCTLVGAKAKVAPIKTLSIPRLELQAAVLGTRYAQFVLENHQIPIQQQFYWTDSSTVLHWINSDSRKYRPYVACRIGEIVTTTDPTEWMKVPSAINVADKATKWGNGPCFDPEDSWFRGPQFLWSAKECWPVQNWRGTEATEELHPVLISRHVFNEPVIDVSRFSKRERLLRTVAYILKFGSHEKSPCSEVLVNSQLLRKAEIKLWKIVQSEAFPVELTAMQKTDSTKPSGAVPVSSPLYKLSAFVDEEGLVRMDGRIGTAPNLPTEAKYPVILAQNHPVTFLFVDYYHRRYLHRNQETVVNELRQVVYIPGIRRLVRKVAARCQTCKVYNASLNSPKMGPLPRARVEGFVRAFTYTGLDYFGPMIVKVGRRHAKRWVALFTCLTTRAIHMEVAHSMSTESCKMCIRRFIARRGAPAEIYSDNGTNFRGAANDLQEQIQRTTQVCAETFTNTTTKWYFNPPAAPHMGGVREYLPTITRRTKWFKDTKSIEVGDLVFVANEQKRNTWVRGQVIEVIRGKDGVTRQAMVRTEAGVIRRPAVKLAVIEVTGNGKVAACEDGQSQPYGSGNVGTALNYSQSP